MSRCRTLCVGLLLAVFCVAGRHGGCSPHHVRRTGPAPGDARDRRSRPPGLPDEGRDQDHGRRPVRAADHDAASAAGSARSRCRSTVACRARTPPRCAARSNRTHRPADTAGARPSPPPDGERHTGGRREGDRAGRRAARGGRGHRGRERDRGQAVQVRRRPRGLGRLGLRLLGLRVLRPPRRRPGQPAHELHASSCRGARPGEGQWITSYANGGHSFLVVAGLRFDTGYNDASSSGPKWSHQDAPDGRLHRPPPRRL